MSSPQPSAASSTPAPDTLGILGTGQMATALLQGWIRSGWPARQITVFDRHPEKAQSVHNAWGCSVAQTPEALLNSTMLLLAVKPKDLLQACDQLTPHWSASHSPVVISIAAGVLHATLQHHLPKQATVVRAMPNLPVRVGQGVTGLYTPSASDDTRHLVEALFARVGLASWLLEEDLFHAVTALSGSGPAFFAAWLEACIQAGEHLGLPTALATQATLQTAQGTLALAMESSLPLLRQQVTSKGGTTAAGLSVLTHHHLNQLLQDTLKAACDQAHALAKEHT